MTSPASLIELDAAARELMRPAELLQRYPALKRRTLEYWLAHAPPREVSIGGQRRVLPGNGLEPAIVRRGRMLWIRTSLFLRWWLEGDVGAALPEARAEAFERRHLETASG